MKIDSAFSVTAPIDQVWDTLMDFERVAGCLPGAKILNKLSEDAYQVGMTVKLGPVTMQYKGLLNVIERDAAGHRAVLGGKAQETRGQGTAEATATLSLTDDGGGTTRGTVSADLALSGKAAVMGKSVIGSVSERMMAIFAENLQAMLAGTAPAGEAAPPQPDQAPAAGPAPVQPPEPAGAADAGPAAAAPGTEPAPAAAPAGSGGRAVPAGALDAVGLAKGIAAEQLASPGKVAVLIAAVACVAYWTGRRSAIRTLRLCGRI